jgi:hypothetical protein
MSIEAAPLDITQHTAQYELLRSQVIGAAGGAPQLGIASQPRGVGLALLLREGMPAWLKAVDQVLGASSAKRTTDIPRPPTTQHSVGRAGPVWPLGVQPQDVTTFLTSLVLSTRRVACSQREEAQPCQ